MLIPVALCFLTVTLAAPQGYFHPLYPQPYNYPGIYNVPLQPVLQNAIRHARENSPYQYGPNIPNLSLPTNLGNHIAVPVSHLYKTPQNQQPIITKDVFVHAAPEEPQEPDESIHGNFGAPRKHYRIIFIRAPSPSHKRVTVAQPAHEEKTIIYVLSKKTEPSDIQTVVHPNPLRPSKPEVFFIKYKTDEEAAFAQEKIQAQFDSIEGPTHVSNEAAAPVTSVIGALDKAAQPVSVLGPIAGKGEASSSAEEDAKYLPSKN